MKRNLLLLAFLAISMFAKAQSNYDKAVDLYNKEMYVEAQQQFQQVRAATPSTDKTRISNIDYYNAICALKLNQGNAETVAEQFIDKYPNSKRRNDLMFNFGLYYDGKKAYGQAAKYFSQVNRIDLTKREQGEYNYKYGFALMKSKKNDEALQFFADAKDSNSRYASPAEYYYAHILYEQKKYAAALPSFEKLNRDADYKNVAPYYILQIYFYQQEYDRVISEGTAFYPKAQKSRQAEVAHVIADAYLKKGDNAKAREYYKKYEAASAKGKVSREDYYLMAYSDYESGEYEQAAQNLEKVQLKNDELSQKAAYLKGGVYMNLGNKEQAMSAFELASKMNYDSEIQSDANLNYAKLAVELKGDSKPMNEFLEKNKSKAEDPQLRNVLEKSYISDKRYDEVINLVEKTPNAMSSDFENLQKAAYFAGLEKYKTKNIQEAINYFDKSLQYKKYNASIASLAEYWKSECLFSQKNYAEACTGLQNFINTTPDKTTNEYKMAHYTLGYCDYDEENYGGAVMWFGKFMNLEKSTNSPFVADCYNRIGDCLFKKREFAKASEYYTKAQNLGTSNPDYALYQNALAAGFMNNIAKKHTLLDKVVSQYPNTSYAPASLYENGRTYVQQNDYANAERNYKTILSKYNKSTYYRKALIELGLISINKNNNEAALSYYKKVVDEYPETPEAADALAGIKDIYVDMGNVDDYFAYADKNKLNSTSGSDRDSLSFVSAERQYLTGDCDKSITAMRNYIKNYPKGENALKASYYMADCYYRNNKFNEATVMFDYVVNQPRNEFTDDALMRNAKAKYQLEDFKGAGEAFERVEKESQNAKDVSDAQILAMRSFKNAENYASTINMATKVAASAKDEEIKREALITKAHALDELDQDDAAIDVYKVLAKNPKTAEGAEATYNVINNMYENGKLDEAENAVYKFSKSTSGNDSWVARSFIVLGNIYIDKENYFQAKATLNSIVENYKNTDDGILDEAKRTLESIKDKN